jgi:hypothetical protein
MRYGAVRESCRCTQHQRSEAVPLSDHAARDVGNELRGKVRKLVVSIEDAVVRQRFERIILLEDRRLKDVIEPKARLQFERCCRRT